MKRNRSHPSIPRYAFLAALVFLSTFPSTTLAKEVAVTDSISVNRVYGHPGIGDFIEYWSAYQILQEGGNPYDPYAMHQRQIEQGQDTGAAIMMWNPPWLLVLLGPVLQFDLQTASTLWFGINLLLCASAVLLIFNAHSSSGKLLWSTALGIVFYPLAECLLQGQIGILLLVIFSLFYWNMKREKYVLAGFFFSLLSIKPHLFYLPALLILYWIIQSKRWGVFLGIGLGALTCLGSAFLLSNDVPIQWIKSFQLNDPSAPYAKVVEWQVATLPGLTRQLIHSGNELPPLWPLWALPLLCTIGTFFWLFKRQALIDWDRDLAPILCLSIATAPYGWLYDQSVLLFCQSCLLIQIWASQSTAQGKVIFTSALLALQVGMLLTASLPESGQHYFVWFPPVLFLAWILLGRTLKEC